MRDGKKKKGEDVPVWDYYLEEWHFDSVTAVDEQLPVEDCEGPWYGTHTKVSLDISFSVIQKNKNSSLKNIFSLFPFLLCYFLNIHLKEKL